MRISKRAGIGAASLALFGGLATAGVAAAVPQSWPGEPACLEGQHAGKNQMKVYQKCPSTPVPPGPEGVRVSVAVPHAFDPPCQWTTGSESAAEKPLFWVDPTRQYKPYFCDA